MRWSGTQLHVFCHLQMHVQAETRGSGPSQGMRATCSKTQMLLETCSIQNLLQLACCAFSVMRRVCRFLECARNKPPFFHSDTEAEVIYLDAGLRMKGLLALRSWECAVHVLAPASAKGNLQQFHSRTERPIVSSVTLPHSGRTTLGSDHAPQNVAPSNNRVHVFVFEDKEAMIKIITGRSPTVRRVSRTHRAGLNGSADRVNLESTISLRYVNIEVADVLTKRVQSHHRSGQTSAHQH